MTKKLKIIAASVLAIAFMPVFVTYTTYGTEGPVEVKYNTYLTYEEFDDLRAQVFIQSKPELNYYGLWFHYDESVPTGIHFYVSYKGDEYSKITVSKASITYNGKVTELELASSSDDIRSRGGSAVSMGGVDIFLPKDASKKDLEKFSLHVDGELLDKNGIRHALVYDKELISWDEVSIFALFWYYIFYHFIVPTAE